MAKNSITDYSKTASLNTDIQSVDIDEGCLPSGINNAIRELMADLAAMNDGTVSLTSPAFTLTIIIIIQGVFSWIRLELIALTTSTTA